MTTEKAISIMKAQLQCLINNSSGLADNCDNRCEDCSLNYEKGTMEEQKQTLAIAINTLSEGVGE